MNSKRASIFAGLLPYINSEDWQHGDGFIVFGLDGFYKEVLGDLAETSEFDVPLRKFADQVKTLQGERELAGRITMNHIPESRLFQPLRNFLEALPPEKQKLFLDAMIAPAPDHTFSEIDRSDFIDASLASDFISDLEMAFTRVCALDKLEFSPISYNTAGYFEEAHRCNLYGQKIAAAVLCRAVIEDSLRKRFDSNGILRNEVRGTEESYFNRLLTKAESEGVLDSERIEIAKLIRTAGNSAAHDLSTFKAKFSPRISELVDGMRKILEDIGRSS